MLKNKFSIYVIENSLELLIKINENYYINAMKNNLGTSFHSKSSNEDMSDEEEDGEEEFSYQNFCKLKNKFSNILKIIQLQKKKENFGFN